MANEDPIRQIVRDAVRQFLLESNAVSDPPAAYSAPWTRVEYDAHPTRQSFPIPEASTMLKDLLEFIEPRICSLEPAKPCDSCGMCRSLGF
jgi:hypothetical protein